MNASLRQIGWLMVALVVGLVALWLAPSHHVRSQIVDISWPNCGRPVYAQQGIVGVTGGLDFRPNKCLSAETGWLNSYTLYMNTGYPGRSRALKFANSPTRCNLNDENCLAYNYGYNATRYAIELAARQNVHSGMWWLDVETDNSWSSNQRLNVASLDGAFYALQTMIPFSHVGFYSYPAQWQLITGGWHNDLPAWTATGLTKLVDAQAACHEPSFTGGRLELAQYTPALVDFNYACSSQ